MNKQKILDDTFHYVKNMFENEGSGHDWWHISRVRNVALKIAEHEGGDVFIIEMAALLHDLDDDKLFGNEHETGSKTKSWLMQVGLDNNLVNQIEEIINQVSFKGGMQKDENMSLEAKIVQDADRLDAIGAIGIARAFAYGGSKGRLLYHPGIEPIKYNSFEEYRKSNAPTINHFYEKLLLLKERINTSYAKKVAQGRHDFMVQYLIRFFSEWGYDSKLQNL